MDFKEEFNENLQPQHFSVVETTSSKAEMTGETKERCVILLFSTWSLSWKGGYMTRVYSRVATKQMLLVNTREIPR